MFRGYRKATPGCNELKTLSITVTVLIQRVVNFPNQQTMFPNPQNGATLRGGPLEKIISASIFVKKKLPNDGFMQTFIVLIHCRSLILFMTLYAIWYHLYYLKNVNNTHTCYFTESNTPPWVFSAFFKLCKLYQIWKRIIYHCFWHSATVPTNVIFD